jgi:hypothetical protein
MRKGARDQHVQGKTEKSGRRESGMEVRPLLAPKSHATVRVQVGPFMLELRCKIGLLC